MADHTVIVLRAWDPIQHPMHVTLKNSFGKYFDIGGGVGGGRNANESEAGIEAGVKAGGKLGLKLVLKVGLS
jgi:hypothetical protein